MCKPTYLTLKKKKENELNTYFLYMIKFNSLRVQSRRKQNKTGLRTLTIIYKLYNWRRKGGRETETREKNLADLRSKMAFNILLCTKSHISTQNTHKDILKNDKTFQYQMLRLTIYCQLWEAFLLSRKLVVLESTLQPPRPPSWSEEATLKLQWQPPVTHAT